MHGRLQLFDHFNLDVANGDVVTLLGRNGSGKSTLFRILAGLDSSFTADRIEVPGHVDLVTQASSVYDPGSRPRNHSRPFVGYAVQDYKSVLLPWYTAIENIKLAVTLAAPRLQNGNLDARVQCALNTFLVHERWAGNLPRALSGGQAQRVVLARALITEPSCLLLDEPFSALDFDVHYRIMEAISKELHRLKTTTLGIVHSIEDAVFLANKVLILSPGHPTSVMETFDIPFPMPRSLDLLWDPQFILKLQEIRAYVLARFPVQ